MDSCDQKYIIIKKALDELKALDESKLCYNYYKALNEWEFSLKCTIDCIYNGCSHIKELEDKIEYELSLIMQRVSSETRELYYKYKYKYKVILHQTP